MRRDRRGKSAGQERCDRLEQALHRAGLFEQRLVFQQRAALGEQLPLVPREVEDFDVGLAFAPAIDERDSRASRALVAVSTT